MHEFTGRRAVLVAPASDEHKARRALQSSADEVILDLEDAVVAAQKVRARDVVGLLVGEAIRTNGVSVRINGLGTGWAREDLAMCASLPGLGSVVLPKAETGKDVLAVAEALTGTTIGVQALIETPLGVRNVGEIAGASARLQSVIIGYADLGAAMGRARSAGPAHWLMVQDTVLSAARVAGVAAIDGPHLAIADDDAFRHWCEWTRDLGFDGKWVIHPAQVETATRIFTPSARAVADAERVLGALREAEACGSGAAQLDGQMLDEAVAIAARRVLAQVRTVSR